MTTEHSDDLIEISESELDASRAIQHVSSELAGGIDIFLGTTRAEKSPEGKSLVALDYECYESMATSKLRVLCARAREQWDLQRLAIFHRIGRVGLMKPSVIVAVSSAHRAEAFAACRFLIDELKRSVPIWKKEVWEDGSVTWVEGTIPEPRG